MFSLIFLFS